MKIYNFTLVNDEADIVLKDLPVKFVSSDTKAFGLTNVVISSVLGFFSFLFLLKNVMSSGSLTWILISLGVLILCIPLFILGLNLLKKRREITINQEFVSKSYVTLFEKDEWQEPVSAYKGILMRTDAQPMGEQGKVLIYALDLVHENPVKTIRLFKSIEYKSVFEKWKEYCHFFDRTPLERIAKDVYIGRESKELGKALIDLIKEGKITVHKTPPAMPPDVEITTDNKGEMILLPEKIVVLLGKTSFTVSKETFWKSEIKFEYADVKAVMIDYGKLHERWDWGIVVLERSSVHRSFFGNELPYETLNWLHYYLTSKIIKEISEEKA